MCGVLTFLDPRDEVKFVKAYYGARRKAAALIRVLTGTSWLVAAASTALHVIHLRAAVGESTGQQRQQITLAGIQILTGIYQLFLAGFLVKSSEERCLKDERLVAYSATFETWSLMAVMLVGRESLGIMNYAPLLACFHAIYAAACNMRLHTLLYLHALGFLCFLFVEIERAMGAILRPAQATPGNSMSAVVRGLVWNTAIDTGVYVLCCIASSSILAVAEVRARSAFLAEDGRDEADLGPLWLFVRNLVKPFTKTPPSRSSPGQALGTEQPYESAPDAETKEHPE